MADFLAEKDGKGVEFLAARRQESSSGLRFVKSSTSTSSSSPPGVAAKSDSRAALVGRNISLVLASLARQQVKDVASQVQSSKVTRDL